MLNFDENTHLVILLSSHQGVAKLLPDDEDEIATALEN